MSAALTPSSEESLAQIVREARAAGRSLEIIGGGSRAKLGPPIEADQQLSTGAMDEIIFYEPGELTLTAQAGAKMKDIEALLRENHQRLAFEPYDHRAFYGGDSEPTLGGMVACNISGPRRIAAGACRDALLGLRFVNGRGEAIKAGGRVMKNVTGYDLTRLLCGSHGALGAITQISLKTASIPEAELSLVIEGLEDKAAVRALAASFRTPYEPTAAAHIPAQGDAPPRTLIRLESFESAIATRARNLRKALASHGDAQIIEAEESQALWREIKAAGALARGEGALWRISVKPTDGPKLVETVSNLREAQALYDWCGGLVWLRTPDEDEGGAQIIRAQANALGGHATLIDGPEALRGRIPAFQPKPAPLEALTERVKAAFDPDFIFNPGKLTKRAA